MAANRNRYADNTLTVQKDGVNYLNLIAIHATDYVNEGTIKQLFHLDYVHKVQDGYFIGGIKVSGSGNLKFHDTSNKNVDGTTNSKGDASAHQRLSHMRVRGADGVNYALFNDAGLNTKPDCVFRSIANISDSDTPLLWAGYPLSRVAVGYYEATFVDTTDRVVRITKGTKSSESSSGGARQNTITTKEQIVNTGEFVEGDAVTVSIITTNAEGSITKTINAYVGAEVGLPEYWEYRDISETDFWLVNPTSKMDLYLFTTDAEQLGNNIGTSAGSAASLNIRMYTDDRMNRATGPSNIPPDGWYISDGTNAYYLKNGVVQSRRVVGQVTKKSVIAPAIYNGRIYITIKNAPLSSAVTVTGLLYYDAIDGGQTGQPQTFSINLVSGLAVGTNIDTGINATMVTNYARFSLSTLTGFENPITDLTKASDGEQEIIP